VLVARQLPETLPRNRRAKLRPLGILLTYRRLLATRQFLVPIVIASFAQAALFVFIAGSPFVFVTLHKISPTWFGLLFALHAICLIGASQFNAPLLRRFGARRLIAVASLAVSLAALAFMAVAFSGLSALWPLVLLTLLMFLSLSQILAPAFLAAMEPFGAVAGAAAAIGAGMEFTFSSVTTFLMGVSADGTARPMAIALAVSACGTLGGGLYFACAPARPAQLV
jgi:DHA1 family bicyclomycin/chloramphenicol resistance-like MFS transporter